MKLHYNDISLKETSKVIESILSLLSLNKIVIFEGKMGSGKTTLIKHLCGALSVTDLVSSPTYSLVNEYKTSNNDVIYHFDFYRIKDIEEALDMGVEEYFYSGNLCFIEWADKIIDILPDRFLKISIEYNQELRNYHIEQF
jgi:tRNA threonylcarbamoyladenosine biosynthesis protein TsaE